MVSLSLAQQSQYTYLAVAMYQVKQLTE